jgi:hypothetical protein
MDAEATEITDQVIPPTEFNLKSLAQTGIRTQKQLSKIKYM